MIFNLKKILKRKRYGFTSLAEVIAALVIASMLAVIVINIYARVNNSANSLERFLEKDDKANSVLQRIAEDIDNLATPGTDAILTLENKFSNGFNICRLSITSRIYDKSGDPQVFERVVWQSSYDEFADSITIYRSHSGMTLEDKVLADFETMLDAWQGRELFVPVVSGVSFFKIDVPKYETTQFTGLEVESEEIAYPEDIEAVDVWNDEAKLPQAVRLSISFGEVVELPTGGFDVYPEDKIWRTVAIDRVRKIQYRFFKVDYDLDDINDVNDFNDMDDFNDVDFDDVNDVDPNMIEDDR